MEEFGGHVQRMHADRDKWFELEYEVRAKTATALNFFGVCSLVCVVLCVYRCFFCVDLTEHDQLLPRAMLLLLLVFMMLLLFLLLLLQSVSLCPPT